MDLELDPVTRDLLVEGGLLSLVRGADAVRQRLELRLALVRGAWFLDLAQGVPYIERILIKGADVVEVAALLRAEALRDSEIREAQVDVTLDSATRAATARATALLAGGVRIETSVTLLPGAS